MQQPGAQLVGRARQGHLLLQIMFHSSQKSDKSKLEWFLFQSKQGTLLVSDTF